MSATPARFDALGFRFELRRDEPALADEAERLLAGLLVPDGSGEPDEPGDRAAEGRQLTLTADPPERHDAALAALVGTINMAAIAAAAGRLLLHAGAVADSRGRAALLCGPSGSGKSTLTTLLTRRGLSYLTDETVCLDPGSLRLTPYRKPLSIKAGSAAVLPELTPADDLLHAGDFGEMWLVPAPALSAPEPPAVVFPDLVVFPTYAAGAGLTEEDLSAGEAAYLLGTNASHLGAVSGGPLPALARLARRARCVRLRFDDGPRAAARVAAMLESAA